MDLQQQQLQQQQQQQQLQQQYIQQSQAAYAQQTHPPPPPPTIQVTDPQAYQKQQLDQQHMVLMQQYDQTMYNAALHPSGQPPNIPQEAMQAAGQQPTQRSEGSLRLNKIAVAGTAVSNGPATPSTPRVPSQPTTAPLIGEKLDALLHSIDPSFTLTPEAAEVLLSLADDFVEKVVEQSELVALHREKAKGGGATGGTVMGYGSEINVGDVSLILRERWGISIPGLQQQGSSVSGSSDAEIAKIFQPGGTWATGEVAGGGKKRGGGGAGKK